jgi:DNA uptake protein ComE-like DNA-binding protein
MKAYFLRSMTVILGLLLTTGLAGAVDLKVLTPDVKGAAVAGGDTTKSQAAAVKSDVKKSAADAKAPAAAVKQGAKAKADAAKAAATAKAAGTKTVVKSKIVDLNTATDAELKAVPGIGDAYAAKIIAGRPYANKAQLKSRKIMPKLTYEQVKDLIIAKQPKK